jgi:hypothetical protein
MIITDFFLVRQIGMTFAKIGDIEKKALLPVLILVLVTSEFSDSLQSPGTPHDQATLLICFHT